MGGPRSSWATFCLLKLRKNDSRTWRCLASISEDAIVQELVERRRGQHFRAVEAFFGSDSEGRCGLFEQNTLVFIADGAYAVSFLRHVLNNPLDDVLGKKCLRNLLASLPMTLGWKQ